MKISIPEFSLVLLVGTSGAGKSTFARAHFRPTEIISSDYCRALVSDDENDQSVSKDAFDLVYFIAAKRLAHGRPTVIDATNVQPEAREPLVTLAQQYQAAPVAIVFDLPERIVQERHQLRSDRDFHPQIIHAQYMNLQHSLPQLAREGFHFIYMLSTPEEVASVEIERQRG